MKKAKDSGKPFVDRKQTAAITVDDITGAVIKGVPHAASSSHDFTFAVTDSSSMDNYADWCKKLVVLLLITFMHEPVSALQDSCDTSWSLVDSG